ncbi:uncharacterized protein ACOB8E_000145 isoform 2-T4 [Sarcophilus harrisii]
MASSETPETTSNKGPLSPKATRSTPSCRCCCWFLEVLSGACLLLLVTVLITLLRYFLEFPAIMEGFSILQSANSTSVPKES